MKILKPLTDTKTKYYNMFCKLDEELAGRL